MLSLKTSAINASLMSEIWVIHINIMINQDDTVTHFVL
ncbi:hypothetical protein yfred0001_15580 [Yersinia frederiksenii ATCC 33641]|nr:hypothetical protein yfred0001_15580 [Yersinia frederiksenii ATCC 33641]